MKAYKNHILHFQLNHKKTFKKELIEIIKMHIPTPRLISIIAIIQFTTKK